MVKIRINEYVLLHNERRLRTWPHAAEFDERGPRHHNLFIIIINTYLYPTMKLSLAFALVGSAAAFAPQASVSRLLLSDLLLTCV